MKRALLLLLLASCGKEEARDALDTAEYRDWKQTQFLRRLPAANFAPTTPGRIEIYAPEKRSKNPDDFCELFLNGESVGKYRVAKMADGKWPHAVATVTFLTGPNTFDVWDSSSNRHYRQAVDTREAVHFLCVPTADGYDIQAVKKQE